MWWRAQTPGPWELLLLQRLQRSMAVGGRGFRLLAMLPELKERCPQISGSSSATKQLERRWRIVYTG